MANALGRPTIYVNQGAAAVLTIQMATNAAFTNNVSYVVKSNIVDFKATFNPQPGSAYPYLTQTMGYIHLVDDTMLTFELQDVNGHATWITGNQAACNAFMSDIAASL